jgi:CMP/dCMP kinase
MDKNVIAIDGASGTGKSTISKLLAKNLDLNYIDTGAIYRSVALKVKKENISLDNEEKLKTLCENIPLKFVFIDGKNHVFLEKEDVSEKIRTQEISMLASKVSSLKVVRDALIDIQHRLAKETIKRASILDGRDIGTVIFPNADLKIFLTASDSIRAKRRYEELKEKGINANFNTVLKETIERDKNDSQRLLAPLKKADDSIEINTDKMNIEEVFFKIKSLIKEKINLC